MDIQKVHINRETTYHINGKKYSSLDEMPPDIRAQVEQAEQMHGIDSGLPGGADFSGNVTKTRFEVNGQEFNSLEEMPPEFRAFFADHDGNGLPDVMEAALGSENPLLQPKRVTKVETMRETRGGAGFTDATAGQSAADIWEQKRRPSKTVSVDGGKLIAMLAVGILLGAAAVLFLFGYFFL